MLTYNIQSEETTVLADGKEKQSQLSHSLFLSLTHSVLLLFYPCYSSRVWSNTQNMP